ncbi:MAG: HAD family hydrolase [Alphaproteobacteria bacterium]
MTLVIFDCDGVLVDSEPISIAVLREIIADAGVTISENVAYHRFLGRNMATIAQILERDFGLNGARDHLAVMRETVNNRFRENLSAIRNIVPAIDKLPMPICVASSSQPDRIRLSLQLTGLLERFEPHIYSSSMVEHGKPAPDLFLHAARSMGVASGNCVVVEDRPAGIDAARRAGMRVLGFTGGSHAGPAHLSQTMKALKPDAIFDDMADLPQLLAGFT